MAFFFTVTLGVSIVGMVSLLLLKRWELSTGRVIGGSARPAVGAAAHKALVWLEYVLPGLVEHWVKEANLFSRTVVHRLSALGVVLTERSLERLLRVLRRKTAVPRNDTEASAFLREVSAHKAELLRSARKRVIYEE